MLASSLEKMGIVGSPWEERRCSPAIVGDNEGGGEFVSAVVESGRRCRDRLWSRQIRVQLVVADLLDVLDHLDGASSVVVLVVDGEGVDVLPGDGGDGVSDG
ncbi:hypothetical protein ACLOJK_040554 [Asimina triloba]